MDTRQWTLVTGNRTWDVGNWTLNIDFYTDMDMDMDMHMHIYTYIGITPILKKSDTGMWFDFEVEYMCNLMQP
jgi:hypothetical protein